MSAKTPLLMAALVLALSAPAAQAQTRDVGMSQIIAVQGNLALLKIKTELKESLKAFTSALPAKPARAQKVRLAPVNGLAVAVRCAK